MTAPKTFTASLIAALAMPIAASAVEVSKDLEFSGSVESTGADPGGFGESNFYGSGNDDGLGSYGIATFQFSAAEFGAPVLSIDGLTLSLSHDNRGFTDGDEFELFLTTDDFADDLYAGLAYDDSGASDPNGIDPSDFGTLLSLGVFPYTPSAADAGSAAPGQPVEGDTESFVITLDLSDEAALVAEINANSQFSILIGATDIADDVTFTGQNNFFSGGIVPNLTINATAIPEPTSLLIFGVATGVLALRRRRSA
ncbi:MAG: PEP-CTERM sorting domain-containing protein [Planctomycetota bacterium]